MNDIVKSIYEYWAAIIDSWKNKTFTDSQLIRYTPNTLVRAKSFLEGMLIILFEENKLDQAKVLIDCWPGDVSVFLAFALPDEDDLTLEVSSYSLLARVQRGTKRDQTYDHLTPALKDLGLQV
jgi:hypothetical protein